jgi:Tectonin domain
MKTQRGKSFVAMLVLALGIAYMQSASAQSFKRVTVSNNTPLAQVASGGASVWALASNGNPYIFNGTSFVLANTISLSQIAVGGGNAAQADAVWALNSSGSIYRAHNNGTSWVFSQVPGSLDLVEVGPGYQDRCHPYEVWGLNTGSQIYRYNFCTKSFDQEPGFLCDIHVGGGDIWGAACGPNVYRFNFSTGNFDPILDPFGAFPTLTVGPGGVEWAIDTSTSDVYRYDDSAGFVNLGCCLTQIQAGGNGVWGVKGNNTVYRWEASAQHFGQVAGLLTSISVGSGGGVWGINSSQQVFRFTTP